MCAVQPDWQRPWLIGGGFSAPWSYADLATAVVDSTEPSGAPEAVGEVLLRLTWALYHGVPAQLETANFAGEGGSSMISAGENGSAGLPDRAVLLSRLLQRRDSEVTLATSGSTGHRRNVTHRLASLARGVVVGEKHRDDVLGLAFDPQHMAGVQVYLQALANGNSIVNLWGVGMAEAIARARAHGVTHLSATPTFYRLLLAMEQDLPTLRSLSVGGESADSALLVRLRAQFPRARIRNIYASTEAGTLLVSEGEEFSFPKDEADAFRIADARLWIHRRLLGKFDGAAEWYDTGDNVEITAEAPLRFRIVGRRGSWINVGGEKVNPVEVEAVLAALPGIAAARVFGRRNSVTGEVLVADVVPRGESPTESEVRSQLAAVLPAYKIPRIIRFVTELETNRAGKVSRHG